MSHIAEVLKQKSHLLKYYEDPSYPGYQAATDPRYDDSNFRMNQARRYYLSPRSSSENFRGFDAYWTLVYCNKEIEQLAQQFERQQNLERCFVNVKFDEISKSIYDAGQFVDRNFTIKNITALGKNITALGKSFFCRLFTKNDKKSESTDIHLPIQE